jgi:primosomal protein N' (replication factor Y)
MIKSSMSYVDVLFPLALRPLTYRCSGETAERAEPGMIVSAPLKNTLTRGLIIETNTSPPRGPVKEISEIHGAAPAISRKMLKLIQWMSDYYLAPAGAVLRQTLPGELFAGTRERKGNPAASSQFIPEPLEIPPQDIFSLTGSVDSAKFNAFLIHAPSSLYEYSLVMNLVTLMKNVIVLLPEVSRADLLFSLVEKVAEERVCLLHGDLSKGRRTSSVERIVSGRSDIVIGTRSALFAPMKEVSMILVLNEHCTSYKLEEGVRYSIRDVAVMRGYLEKSTVVLSSVTPSVDSYFNAFSGKYRLLTPAPARHPRAQIVDMRFCRKTKPNLSKTVYDMARNRVESGKKIMFVINRRGYSTLVCGECGHSENCPDCGIPMVMHKDIRALKCHYCGIAGDLPDKCSRCGSLKLELTGTGTQRVQEELGELLKAETVRFDSDEARGGSSTAELLRTVSGESAKILIGTKMMTKRVSVAEKFSMAAVLNIDSSLNFPDFRTAEKTYRELAALMELVEPGGDILIQTRFPENPVFRHLKKNDYASFVREELTQRKALLYPPYSRLLSLTFSGDKISEAKILKGLKDCDSSVEILGPAVTRNRKGKEVYSVLLKSTDRSALRKTAKNILDKYRNEKGVEVTTDMDPV